MKTMLTIAGFDPSSGAGITADLAVFAAERCFGTSCITALTVQSTIGVQATEAVPGDIIAATLDCLDADLPPAGIKIGMLATPEAVEAVAAYLEGVLRERSETPIVLDPVLRSSSGRELLNRQGIDAMKNRLLPLAGWITPNLAELSVLLDRPVGTAAEMEAGALALRQRYRTLGVVVTGGHLAGNRPAEVADLVVAPLSTPTWVTGERVESRSTHGTGCAYSSTFACGLAKGLTPFEAAHGAQHFVAQAIRHAVPMGRGNGPMNLFWRLTP
jgi:hydroxymethylpyrimidine/phosphomethylpyrimidine kinase